MKRIILLTIFLVLQAICIVDRTYYIYLGLDISATSNDITQAYVSKKEKILALQDQDSRDSKLKMLEEAYFALSNPDRRSTYDRLNKDQFANFNVVSNLKKLSQKNNRKSKPILLTLPVSVEDVYLGKTIEATFLRQRACNKCRGTGAESPKFLTPCAKCAGNGFTVIEGNTCQSCNGWGKTISKVCPVCGGRKIASQLEKVQIKIPEGLPDGNKLKIPNFGDEPSIGAPSDL